METGGSNAASSYPSPESPTHGEQEVRPGTVNSAALVITRCSCSTSDLERCRLRPRNVHGAKDWRPVLELVIARYRRRGVDPHFRVDAAFAKPEIYELLEAEGMRYAIRLPAS